MNRLKERYYKEIAPKIIKDFSLENKMQVPNIKKVCINVGIGPFRENKEAVDQFVSELSDLAGQKAYPRKARLSEAGFKIKKGDIVGYAVTLRGDRMWAFIDKLISIAIPRVRDFRGLSNSSFDGEGNYSLGIKEHVIFPEVNANTIKGIRSMQVTIVFNSSDVDMNRSMLTEIGFPFKQKE